MTKTLKQFLVINLALVLISANGIVSRAQSTWTPPTARLAKTPLAPKPHKSNNIFHGEGEVWLADAIQELEGGCFTPMRDEAVSQYVSRVGAYVASHSVAPTKQYQFVVTTDSSPDAMTTGAGRIYISIGMLRLVENEDELAGILAHEIAHDALGHIPETLTRQLFWMTHSNRARSADEVRMALAKLLEKYHDQPIAELVETLLGFARFNELEADRAAFYNAYKAGYNPMALSSALKLLARKEKELQGKGQYWGVEILMLLLGSHPPDTQRLLALAWESNFVRLPSRHSHVESAAFDAMKKRVKDIE